MDFELTDEQVTLRREIIDFARKELNSESSERDSQQTFPRDLWLMCGEMGFQGLPVPEEYGGAGCDALTTAIALEALGYGCTDGGLVFSVCAHLLACVVPIWKFGTEEQKQRYLPRLCSGELIGVNAMTEPGSGSDAFAMSTRAEAVASGYHLRGTKIFCSNVPGGDLAVVFAITDPERGYHGGVTAFLVETDSPGMMAGQKFEKMGLRTSPLGELVFDDVLVSSDTVLGGVGAGANIFAHSMDWERICLFASHVGTMERLIETSIKQARSRRQFGRPIGDFQAVSHRIADMKIRLEAARLLIYRAAWQLDRRKIASLDASMAKVFVSESFVKAAMDTVQIHGGSGYTKDYEVERVLRDAVGSTIYSGTSEIQRNIIARWLGL
jgi:alkylation response protein AidB-like acyl-CoA dehydrogenase